MDKNNILNRRTTSTMAGLSLIVFLMPPFQLESKDQVCKTKFPCKPELGAKGFERSASADPTQGSPVKRRAGALSFGAAQRKQPERFPKTAPPLRYTWPGFQAETAGVSRETRRFLSSRVLQLIAGPVITQLGKAERLLEKRAGRRLASFACPSAGPRRQFWII